MTSGSISRVYQAHLWTPEGGSWGPRPGRAQSSGTTQRPDAGEQAPNSSSSSNINSSSRSNTGSLVLGDLWNLTPLNGPEGGDIAAHPATWQRPSQSRPNLVTPASYAIPPIPVATKSAPPQQAMPTKLGKAHGLGNSPAQHGGHCSWPALQFRVKWLPRGQMALFMLKFLCLGFLALGMLVVNHIFDPETARLPAWVLLAKSGSKLVAAQEGSKKVPNHSKWESMGDGSALALGRTKFVLRWQGQEPTAQFSTAQGPAAIELPDKDKDKSKVMDMGVGTGPWRLSYQVQGEVWPEESDSDFDADAESLISQGVLKPLGEAARHWSKVNEKIQALAEEHGRVVVTQVTVRLKVRTLQWYKSVSAAGHGRETLFIAEDEPAYRHLKRVMPNQTLHFSEFLRMKPVPESSTAAPVQGFARGAGPVPKSSAPWAGPVPDGLELRRRRRLYKMALVQMNVTVVFAEVEHPWSEAVLQQSVGRSDDGAAAGRAEQWHHVQ